MSSRDDVELTGESSGGGSEVVGAVGGSNGVVAALDVMVGMSVWVGSGAAKVLVETALGEGFCCTMGARVLLPKVASGTACDACPPMDSSHRASSDDFCRHGGDVIPPARNDSSMRTAMKSTSAASCRGGPTNTVGNASSSRVYAACDRTTCREHRESHRSAHSDNTETVLKSILIRESRCRIAF